MRAPLGAFGFVRVTMKCWKCKEKVEGPVCVSCSTIQPPPQKPDYFALFGIEPSYFIEELGTIYRKRSRKLHPDRFINKSAVERRMSLLWMAALNEAKRCLEDPIARARYIATGSAQIREDKKIVLDPEFLERIFSLQMEAMTDPHGVRQRAQIEHQDLFTELECLFRTWEQDKDDTILQRVEPLLARLKYINNLINIKE